MKLLSSIVIALLLCLQSSAQTPSASATQRYPVIAGDLPDPSVLRVGNRYYAAGTSSEWSPQCPLYTSTDLHHWQQLGYVFPQTPSWAASSYWAPELFYYNNTYYVYYAARRTADSITCIGVATSKDPAKGFTDHGVLLQWGREAIDPFIVEDSGRLYMSFKAYGLDKRPIELLCVRLSDDGLKVAGEPFMLLRDDGRKGMEGQCMLRRNGQFYLFYSFGDCCGRNCSYKVAVARSVKLAGPYETYDGNPVLSESDNWTCTGHGTITTTPSGQYFYLYHAYNKRDNVYTGRQAMLGEVTWNATTGWPVVTPVEGQKPAGIRDDFSGSTLKKEWMWDARHSTHDVKLKKEKLYLSGAPTRDNLTGTALTVRPAIGNYTATVKVESRQAALAGLVVYGDAGASVGIGVQGDSVVVWEVKDKEKKKLREVSAVKQPLFLKIAAEDGYRLRFYWGATPGAWQEIATGDAPYNADLLPQWDRCPRPGVVVAGNAVAVFDDFVLQYQ